jgi:hypothetical protein
VAGVSITPGRISRANTLVGGSAALTAVSAPSACSIVGPSSRTDARKAVDSPAVAATVRLKFTSSSCS